MNIRGVVLAGLLALGSANAFADGINDGVVAMLRGESEAAVKVLRPLAEEGHSEAQYYMGYMYETGTGVTKSSTLALKWYKLAGAQGHHGAKVRAHVMMRIMTH